MTGTHVLSVCIFCFICATHSPCSSHADVSDRNPHHVYSPKSPYYDDSPTGNYKPLPFVKENRHKLRKRDDNVEPVIQTVANANLEPLDNLDNHSLHEHIDKSDDNRTNDNLIKIFKMFGDGDSINIEGLEKLLEKLQLKPAELTNLVKEEQVGLTKNGHGLSQPEKAPNCMPKSDLFHPSLGSGANISTSQFYSSICPNLLYGVLVGICPGDEDATRAHNRPEQNITAPQPHTSSEEDDNVAGGNEVNRTLVWIYSICAVCVISFCGILGLAVIPIMQKTFYDPLLQFLVALAVGTLAGDALLHLLPHAMSPHSHSSHGHGHSDTHELVDHNANTWKGLVAMGGLVLFFVMERVIMFASKWHKSQQLKNKQPTRLKVIDPDKSTSVTSAADKQCKHKYSSFPYCYDEIKMIDHTSAIANNRHHNHRLAAGSDDIIIHSDSHHRCNSFPHIDQHNNHSRSHPNITECHSPKHHHQHQKAYSNGHSLDIDGLSDNDPQVKAKLRCAGDSVVCLEQKERLMKDERDDGEKTEGLNGSVDDLKAQEKLLKEYNVHFDGLRQNLDQSDDKSNSGGGDMFGYLNLGHAHSHHSHNPASHHHHHHHIEPQHGNSARPPMNKTPSAESGEYTVILREHRSEHHGHSHAHGHVHAAPSDLSAVVWMVIMGDGLHNFTDGMAIGAAFSSSITGGLSTALAVFCHEVPHELGDFAMLLKAGMSMRQALFYNLLSSVLCLAGNAFGVWLGETEEATSWVFAAAAGMFIYIALVDMIPELSAAHEGDGGTLLQCLLHTGGLLLGIGIMLLIACYESELKQIFNDI